MRFLRFLLRMLGNVLDPVLLVSIYVLLYLQSFAQSYLYDYLIDAITTYVKTGTLISAFSALFRFLLDPLGLLSFLVLLVLNVYMVAFIVARVWQRREDPRINPFLLAYKRMPHVFVALIFTYFLPFLFFLLFLLSQPYPTANIFYLLFLISLALWLPLSFPVLAASVVEEMRGRDIVYEGLLAGKTQWFRIFLGFLAISLIYYLLLPLGFLGPLLSTLLSTAVLIWVYGLAAEAYWAFKHGE